MASPNMEELDRLGLGYQNLFSTQGKQAAEHFPEILTILKERTLDFATRKTIASQMNTWAVCVDAGVRDALFREHGVGVFDMIAALTSLEDDGEDGGDYEGEQEIPKQVADTLSTVSSMDQTQQLAALFMPAAYEAALKIVESGRKLGSATPFVSSGPSICRTETVMALMRIVPYSGTAPHVPTAVPLLVRLIKTGPKQLQDSAKSSLQSMSTTAKENFRGHAGAILELIEAGGNDQLIFLFSTDPELYASDMEGLHAKLPVLFRMPFMNTSSVLLQVAQKNARVLEPYVPNIMQVLRTDAMMASLALMILKEVALKVPAAVFPLLDEIEPLALKAQGGDVQFAGILGAAGKQNSDTADAVLPKLMKLLENPNTQSYVPATVFNEVMNLKELYSSRDVMTPYMELVSSKRRDADTQVQMIEDWYEGLSLKGVNTRIDNLEARIDAMNAKIAETCTNFEDVKAYVDQNMADIKDFVGEIVKKLPNPKRLEVVGTLRKTLILHFECVHTGREYPIESKEWSKWLKMGFSLLKCGKLILDVGTGNPMGILKTGVDAVQQIYSAYKTNDDDEFNTYITQPFLTSAEQDQLLNKLRDQGFFEKFAYDAQAPGWYLINPEDGTEAAGEVGSVTKVKSKKGTGNVLDILSETVGKLGDDNVSGAIELAGAVSELKDGASESKSPASSGKTSTRSPMHEAKSPAKAAAKAPAASGPTGANAERIEVAINNLENRVQALEEELARLKANPPAGGGCCTIA